MSALLESRIGRVSDYTDSNVEDYPNHNMPFDEWIDEWIQIADRLKKEDAKV